MKTNYLPIELAEMFYIFEDGKFKKVANDIGIKFEGLYIETGEMQYREPSDFSHIKTSYPMQVNKVSNEEVELVYMIRCYETETMAKITVPNISSDVKIDNSYVEQIKDDTADKPNGSQGVNLYLLAGVATIGFLVLRRRR